MDLIYAHYISYRMYSWYLQCYIKSTCTSLSYIQLITVHGWGPVTGNGGLAYEVFQGITLTKSGSSVNIQLNFYED